LRLQAATFDSVRAEIGDTSALARLLDVEVPAEWPPESLRDALPVFLEWHRTNPEWTGWLGWYAIRLDLAARVLCGSVGFKGAPDADGMVEIGYSVLPAHQRVGLATEMVDCMVRWAWRQAGVRYVEAVTTADNIGSIRVLERTGFAAVRANAADGSVRFRSVNPWGRLTRA
jgi:ribosomal-protein-alanine N-acetyltransferase